MHVHATGFGVIPIRSERPCEVDIEFGLTSDTPITTRKECHRCIGKPINTLWQDIRRRKGGHRLIRTSYTITDATGPDLPVGYRLLPQYVPSTRVSEDTARQDKIELVLGNWLLGQADDGTLSLFFAGLTTPDASDNFLAGVAPFPDQYRWFSRHTHFNPTMPKLAVRGAGRGRGPGLNSPLVAGSLETKYAQQTDYHASSLGRLSRRLRLRLSINPTRFVHHQPLGEWVARRTLSVDQWDLPAPILFSGRPRLFDLDEVSLDGADNVLFGRPTMLFAKAEAWQGHVQRYWNAFLTTFDGVFRQSAEMAGVSIFPREEINLQSMQTYWEFAVADPPGWVKEIEPVILALGLGAEARTFAFPYGFANTELNGNVRSLTARLASGVKLRIYAKTSKRVRFEIEHDFTANSRPLNSDLGRGHVSSDFNDFLRWVRLAAHDAAEHVNRVLTRLELAFARRGDEASVTDLIIAVTQNVGDAVKAGQILSCLAANSRVSTFAGFDLNESIRRLARVSILQPVRSGSRSYVLAHRFHRAARALSTHPARLPE